MDEPSIVEQRGSHLLVRQGDRFAVVERRVGHIYTITGTARAGHRDSAAGIIAAVGPRGWCDEARARAAFAELSETWAQLAECLR